MYTDLQERIVDEYLRNPFRDEDAFGLSVRLGIGRKEVAEELRILCDNRILKQAPDRGFLLDADGLEQTGSTQPAVASEPESAADEPAVVSADEPAVALAYFHGELFAKLHADLVDPLKQIQEYLDNQEPSDLGPARAAVEQINWMLQEFMLAGKPGSNSDSGVK